MPVLLVKSFFSSASKYQYLVSMNLAALGSRAIPKGIHRWIQHRQMNTKGNLFDNVVLLK